MQGRPIKITEADVKSIIEGNNCKLLNMFRDKKSNIIIRYICYCGNEHENRLSRFKNGARCRKCANNIISNKQLKYSKEYVNNFYKENKCELLESYTNSRTPILYRCQCGNTAKTNFWFFKNGRRCKECQRRNNSGDKHPFWNPDRTKVLGKFARKCQDLLYMTLRSTMENKNSKTYNLLGYGNKELKQHIENHPNWNNVKDKKWSIDHIFPIKAFVDHEIKNPKIINCLENLQPVEKTENIKKGCIYNEDSFLDWIKNKNYTFTDIKNMHGSQGECNPNAKLTKEQVKEIRTLKGTIINAEIARQYGVSKGLISQIMKNQCWKNI